MKKLVHSLVLCGLVSGSAVAMAEEAASPHTLTGNVTLTSNYVFRGISQSSGDPAIQGGLDYTHKSGLYLGTWASSVGWIRDFQLYDSGSMEIDLYGGFRNSIGDTGLSYDVGLVRYMYPGTNNGPFVDADTTEAYAALGWKWFTVKYSHYLTKDVFGIETGGGSNYWDLSASLPVGETGLTLGAHVGTFDFRDTPDADYDDWSVSATYDMGKLGSLGSGVTVGIKYSDTNATKDTTKPFYWVDDNGEYLGKSTTYVWITKAL